MLRRPRLRSFRTRLARLSFLVSALALLAFAIPAWVLIGRLDLRHLDSEVRQRTLPHLAWYPDNRHWGMLDDEIRYTYGTQSGLLVKGRDGRIIGQSPGWPKALNPSRFPLPGGNETGQRLEAPPPPPHRGASPGPPPPPAARLRQPTATTWRDGLQSWRVAVMGNEFCTVVVAVNLAGHERYMLANALALLLALPVAAALAAAGAWLLSGRALDPVRRVTEEAETVTARGLDRRLSVAGEDAEFARLITVFNEMLERLEKSFQQATRFSADAAHELKTPLSILQGELEQAIHEAEAGSPSQQVYGGLLEEVQRLKSIIRKLLLLSLADAGRLELALTPLNLSAALETLREDTEVLAPELRVQAEVAPEVWVEADHELLQQVLQNLASNALKYNRPQGLIQYQLRAQDGQARLRVGNTGPAIPPQDAARIFDRFYRADKARERTVEGFGLGLSLAREIARAHGGELNLVSSTTQATIFELSLPLKPATAESPPPPC